MADNSEDSKIKAEIKTEVKISPSDVKTSPSDMSIVQEQEQAAVPRDDFEDTELDSDVENITDGEEDVDKIEVEMMSMPQLQEVLSELHQMKGERRLMVSNLSYYDIVNDTFQGIVHELSSEEIKLHFVRPKNREQEWSGFMVMHFGSSGAAEEAAETLKEMNPDLVIKTKAETVGSGQILEQWAKSEKGQKHWTDRMLYIKNVAPSVTKEQLEEIFSTADDIVLRPVKNRNKKDENEATREAYAIYRTSDLAQAAAFDYSEKMIELDGFQLRIFKYHTPTNKPLRGYLHLKERRVVLKYLDRLQAAQEAGKEDESFVVPAWCEKRLEACKKLIEQDDKSRAFAGLSSPTLAQLREVPGLKLVRGTERKDLLIKLGVIDKPARDRKRNSDGTSVGNNKGSLLGNAPPVPNLLSLNTSKPASAIPSLLSGASWSRMGGGGTPSLLGSGSLMGSGHSSGSNRMKSGLLGSGTGLLGSAPGSSNYGYNSSHSGYNSSSYSSGGYGQPQQKMLRLDETGYHQVGRSSSGAPVQSLLSLGGSSSRSSNQRGERGGGRGNKPVSLLSL